jgi:hypothetical protein
MQMRGHRLFGSLGRLKPQEQIKVIVPRFLFIL